MDQTMTVSELIGKAAEALKKVDGIRPPEWAAYVKTGVHKERPPVQQDWWYRRAAAVLCAVQKLGPVGV
jgi:small subunit ribosomal protein S19e